MSATVKVAPLYGSLIQVPFTVQTAHQRKDLSDRLTLANPLLQDHAVIQAGVPLPIAGTAGPGQEVAVSLRARRVAARADEAGRWQLVLPALPAGGPETMTIAAPAGASLTLRDLMIGEVWLCAGQSNMAFPLREADGAEEAIRQADRPELGLITAPRRVATEPRRDLEQGCSWRASGPESAAAFSALGYFFGARLNAELKTPVGLIMAAIGDTPAEAWLARKALESDPDYAPILDRARRALEVYPDPEKTYARAFAEWDRAADLAEREGRPIPGAHPVLIGPGHPWTPGGLFNGMIAPLLAHPIRGVAWCQGEAAPERAFQYRKLFRLLIRTWRAAWQLGDFPFLFVQAAAFGPRREQPGEHSWAELREAQQMGLREPNTAMVVALDCGDARAIHPRKKQPVGERLALAAQARVYGRDLAWSGPLFREMKIEGRQVRLLFDHAAQGLRTSDGRPPRGFALSPGAADFTRGDRGFRWAEGRIAGPEVVVESAGVPRPMAARYAWAQNPDCNLVNSAGLPAVPFRTDAYPGITDANR